MTEMQLTLGELARQLGCTLVGGDAASVVTGVSTIERANESEITFLANLRYAPKVRGTKAVAVLASEPLAEIATATLVSQNPYHDFARALEMFFVPSRPSAGIHPLACIASTAVIGANASIGPFAVIGERTTIGADSTIYPHAVIYQDCEIGDQFTAHSHVSVRERTQIGHRVTLHNGVVLGGDGYGFAKTAEGRHYKIVQTGTVAVEDDVEIQTLTSIDRAAIGETRIRRGAKIDSLCQIGHGCEIGEDNIICGQTGLAGSTILKENVIMAGQTGSAGHLTINRNAIVWAQSGLHADVAEGAVVAGSPAYDSRDWLRTTTVVPKLPDLLRRLKTLERKLAALENNASRSSSQPE
jgi:UDP-3-O-[3-hydroxymyristoyl] glucosamine N-acyltransferase